MKSIRYAIFAAIRRAPGVGHLPLCAAVLLAALMAWSFATFGSISPPGPQAAGNAAYQKLWSGNIDGAITGFDRALASDAAFPYRWSDLGEALADAGRMGEAGYCFRRAMELAPQSPDIRLRAANYCFRAGSVAEALSLDSATLRQTPDFDEMIFRSWIRLAGGIDGMLDTGIGANARAAGTFFDFLVSNGRQADLDRAWRWMESRGYTAPKQAREWVVLLLRSDQPGEAADVWAAHVALDPAQYRKSNWIDNPGFESDWQGGGFDWTSVNCAGVKLAADSAIAHGGKRSLRLDVKSGENLDFHHFSQSTWMLPGKYRLEGWVRTRGFTTDEGIGLRVREPVQESSLNSFTGSVTGTSDWTLVSRDFAVIGHPALVEVQIVRKPSWDFDNHPRGTAWVDDIRISPLR